jgi:hypothetical protein
MMPAPDVRTWALLRTIAARFRDTLHWSEAVLYERRLQYREPMPRPVLLGRRAYWRREVGAAELERELVGGGGGALHHLWRSGIGSPASHSSIFTA